MRYFSKKFVKFPENIDILQKIGYNVKNIFLGRNKMNDQLNEQIPNVLLNSGVQIPALGYGVFEIPNEECEKHVLTAISCGYRHIDTAQIYGNEKGVGDAVRASGLPRQELFVTSKIWVKEYGYDRTLCSIDESLKKLQTDYIDLMLLHRPYFDYLGAWKALERALEEGKVRSIGLSNFTRKQTEEILQIANVVPAVNQIELHPYYGQKALTSYLSEKRIAVEAWYPLGHGNKKLLNEPLFKELSEKYQKTCSQIILRWHVQKGNIIFPKTCSRKHMLENMEIFKFELECSDMQKIEALDKNKALFAVPDWVQKLQAKLR